MPKRGIFRRFIERITGGKPGNLPPPVPKPPTPSVTSTETTPLRKPRGLLSQKVINHIVATSPLANRVRVAEHVEYMDIDELEWTLEASPTQIAWRARQDADRLATTADGATIPLNPWWYR